MLRCRNPAPLFCQVSLTTGQSALLQRVLERPKSKSEESNMIQWVQNSFRKSILLVVMVYMQDILLCRNKRVHWWNPLKFYWSLIALEIVRGHCTDNHGKLTLFNRKLVWKIADVPLLGFVVKHHFMCFSGAVLMLGAGLRPWLFTQRKCGLFTSRNIFRIFFPLAQNRRVFVGIRTWVDQPCWKAQLRLVVGRIPFQTALGFRWFVPPSQAFVLRNGGRNGRARWGGALREKRWPCFFSQFLNHQAGWLAKRMFHRKRVYFFRQFQCFFFESTWTTVLLSFVISNGRDTADFVNFVPFKNPDFESWKCDFS